MHIVCHRAQYRPDQDVLLLVRGAPASLRLVVRHLGQTVVDKPVAVSEPDFDLPLGRFAEGGYEVELGDELTAFDVAADPNAYLRYGFLSSFQPEDRSDTSDLDQLLRYRVNVVHFYDWMYRHHEFLPPDDRFTDAMGRAVDLGAVKAKISQAHDRGQRTMAYGAVYGAESEYIASRPQQRLYRADGSPLVFIGVIAFCNIAPGNPWVDNIVEQYRLTVSELGFDGIHMDQYGYPKVAFDYQGRPVDLEAAFVHLIERTKTTLDAVRADNTVLFNAVGDWPTARVAPAPQDAVYIEVWDPHSTYGHLMGLVRKAKALAPSKTVILAAYLHCFNEPGPDEGKIWGALTTTAFIAAAGGTHLLWGETNGALAEGYYVNHGRYDPRWEPLIRAYCEFPVKYREWLMAPADDVSWDRVGGPNREFQVEGWTVTPDASRPGLAATLRRLPSALVIQLLHPAPVGESLWNAAAREPEVVENLVLKVMTDGRPARVVAASPDFGGRLSTLAFTSERLEEGTAVIVTLPQHRLWSMVVVEYEP
jgi:dextranase